MGSTPMTLLFPYWILLCVALLVLAWWLSSRQKYSHWQTVLNPSVWQFLSASSQQLKRWSDLLLMAALVALAMSAPALKTNDDSSLRHTNGWVMIADVSRSMTLDDVVPSRLAGMRASLDTLATQAKARPVALIIFAGDAFLAVPPAFDKTLLREHIALMEYGVIEQDGSNLARALSLASSVIEEGGFVHSRVFVMSDSGGTGNASEAAARHLADQGHRMDVILYGNRTDNTATSANIDSAKVLAKSGNGKLLHATPMGDVPLEQLDLDDRSASLHNAGMRALYWRNQSHWLLLLLIPLMLMRFSRGVV